MEFKTDRVIRYGRSVVEHTEMDQLRKSQCLCLNCKKIKTCPIAKAGYDLCKENNIAFAVTRCPVFEQQKGKED